MLHITKERGMYMKKLKRKMGAFVQRVVDWGMGNGLMQEELTADGHDTVMAAKKRIRPWRRPLTIPSIPTGRRGWYVLWPSDF